MTLPIIRKISPYNHSAGNDVQYIVVHDTGNYNDTDEGNANYFGSADRQASAHLFVDEDSITQVVEFYDAAWHCGDGNNRYGINNHNSIGIEMCKTNGTVSEKTISNTIELIRDLQKQFNVPLNRVVRHYDASRKICPASLSANGWARWLAFKNTLANAYTGSILSPTLDPTKPVPIVRADSNAVVLGDWLYARKIDGSIEYGHVVSEGDLIRVIDISYSRQLALIEYPVTGGTRQCYVTVCDCIRYKLDHTLQVPYRDVFDLFSGVKIGSVGNEMVTVLAEYADSYNVAYDTDKGRNTKSGRIYKW